ncbi:MAG: ketopantoate reductase family protein [Candidatus Hodarchaeales archaeon]|jgi:2-dehydropantoate 2-reductase
MISQDRIFIFGAGAIGIALAINLILNDRKVMIVRTSREDISETKMTISLKNVEGENVEVPVTTISLKKLTNINGIIIVTTKSYVNESIAKQLKEKLINSPIVVMQNGLGVEEPFLNEGFQKIYRCILFATSQTLEKNHVQYKPVAPSPIGIIQGKVENLQNIVTLLNTSGFEFIVEKNIQEVIWQKAIINSVFNSICPLLEVDNGIFYRNKEVLQIAIEIIKECVAVASEIGIILSNDKIRDQIVNISKLSSGQFISTLQDIQNKRKTEIESLNLEIARIAEAGDVVVSTKITKLLGELILLKSENVINSL